MKKRKLLLIDVSGILHSSYHGSKHSSANKKEHILYFRHLVFEAILNLKRKHTPSEIVMCFDEHSWRSDIFKYYKAKRKIERAKNPVESKEFFDVINKTIDIMKKILPYKSLSHKLCEADDVIAIAAKSMKDYYDEIIIASNDKDFRQLIDEKISLWYIKDKTFLEIDDVKEYLIRHCLKGDSSDGIPNVRSDDDVFVDDAKRQKPCGDKTVDKILAYGLRKYLKEEGLSRNFSRNVKLVELSERTIPNQLWEGVSKKFGKIEAPKASGRKLQHYLIRLKLKNLAAASHEFLLKG